MALLETETDPLKETANVVAWKTTLTLHELPGAKTRPPVHVEPLPREKPFWPPAFVRAMGEGFKIRLLAPTFVTGSDFVTGGSVANLVSKVSVDGIISAVAAARPTPRL